MNEENEVKVPVGIKADTSTVDKEAGKLSSALEKSLRAKLAANKKLWSNTTNKFWGTTSYTPKGNFSKSKKLQETQAAALEEAKAAALEAPTADRREYEAMVSNFRRMQYDPRAAKHYYDHVEHESFRDAFTRNQNDANNTPATLYELIKQKVLSAKDAVSKLSEKIKELNSLSFFGDASDRPVKPFEKIYTGAKMAAKGIGMMASKAAPLTKGVFKNATKEVLKPAKNALRFFKSFKTALRFKTIRQLVSTVIRLVKEGLTNLDKYSEHMGTPFHDNVMRLSASLNYLKNAFAAMVGPIVNAVTPALERLMDTFARLANQIGAFFAAITGQQQFSAALKKTVSTTKQAAGKLKDILSFDELNRLSGDTGGGESADEMFEEWGEGSFFDRVKEAFLEGSWAKLGKELATKVNGIIDKLNPEQLGTNLGKKINAVIEFARAFFDKIDFANFGKTVATWFSGMISSINWKDVGGLIARRFTAAIEFFGGMILHLDWGSVARALRDTIVGLFSSITEWVKNVDWKKVGSDIVTHLVDFIKNLEIGTIVSSIFDAMISIIKALGGMIGGFFSSFHENVIKPLLAKIVNALPDWATKILGIDKGKWKIYAELEVKEKIEATATDRDRTLFKNMATVMNKSASELERYLAKIQTVSSGVNVAQSGLIAPTLFKASGGTVDKGQLFIANEAGPELIGNLNGQTSVTNYDQFTQSVIDANSMVVDAVMQVVAAVNNKDLDVYMDSQKVGQSVTQYQNNMARRFGY